MVNFLYTLCNKAYEKYITSGEKKIYYLLFGVTAKITQVVLAIGFRHFDKVEKKIKTHRTKVCDDVVVSLTSYGKRIPALWKAIATMMLQTLRAGKIVLWLSEDEFKSEEELPEELKKLKTYGLEIKFCQDLKSHKKYFFALREYGDKLVITFDDDMYYPADIIEKLYTMHLRYPKDVIAISCAKMGEKITDMPSKWQRSKKRKYIHSERFYYAYTGAGTLYPPRSVHEKAFSVEDIKRLCLTEDDIWMRVMEDLNGVRVTQIEEIRPFPFRINKKQDDALYLVNTATHQDDIWQGLLEEYYGNL